MPAAASPRSPFLALAAFALVPLMSHIIIVETSHVHLGFRLGLGGLFKLGFVTVSALTHWGIYASLLAGFALTLRPGREPLITAMARRLHGDIGGELAAYTRNVTLAWSLFFAAQLALSVALFWCAPLVVWSFFVNILDIPLVAAMFAAEYAVRLCCLKDPPRHSLATIVAMVTDIVAKPRQPEPGASLAKN